jgi:hypothetical protein
MNRKHQDKFPSNYIRELMVLEIKYVQDIMEVLGDMSTVKFPPQEKRIIAFRPLFVRRVVNGDIYS